MENGKLWCAYGAGIKKDTREQKADYMLWGKTKLRAHHARNFVSVLPRPP